MPLLNGDSVAARCSQVPSSLGRNPFGFCCVLTGLAEDESMMDRPDESPKDQAGALGPSRAALHTTGK